MRRLHTILMALALGTVPVVGAFSCWLLWQSKQDEHMLAVQAGAVLTNVARPCKGAAGPDACGTLAQINKAVIDIGNITVTAQKQVNQTALLVAQYGTVLDSIAGDVHGEMAEAQKATVALTGTAQEATATLGTANALIGTERPRLDEILKHTDVMLAHGDETVGRFNAMLADPNIALTMKHVEGITASGDHMLFTADAVETKATKSYLHPSTNPFVRAGQVVRPFLVPGAQIGAAVALH